MHSDTDQQTEDDLSRANQSYSNPFSAINKSRLDKAQARRLKMPKRNRSAYFLFSMDTRAKLKTEFKDQLTPLEMQGKVSQYWRELSPEQKEKYEQRAKEEKLEYLVAMDKFYSNLTPETLAKSKTNRPKKPCSAYAHFVRDIKIDLKKENPKLIMQEILHIASEKWKSLPDQDRYIYEERARVDKEQYMIATRRAVPLNPVAQINPHQINQGMKKSVKPFEMEMNDPSLFEDPKHKQVKTEHLPVKYEMPDHTQGPMKRLKQDDEQETNNTTPSSFAIKAEAEAEMELRNRLLMEQAFNLEQIHLPDNMTNMVFPGLPQGIQMPALNGQILLPSTFTFVPNMPNMGNMPTMPIMPGMQISGDPNELMLSRLSYIKMIQANKTVEEAILRKIEEVKTLQAQRMTVIQNLLWNPNNGTF